MKTTLGLSAFVLALSLGIAAAEQADPKTMGSSDPAPKDTMAPVGKAGNPSESASQPATGEASGQQAAPKAAEDKGSGSRFGRVTGQDTSGSGEAGPRSRDSGPRTGYRKAYHERDFGPRHSFAQRLDYSPRRVFVYSNERRRAYRAGYRRGLAAAGYVRPRHHVWRYAYAPRVRYAYAVTPLAYDYPRETYATGIFPTVSAIGLHTYDYGYTTRVRAIAAYGGPTGSYAGGYPIYNRPIVPAYPTHSCDCD